MIVSDGMEIVAAQAADLEELSALARGAKAHWGYPAEWLEEWRPQLTLTVDDLASRVTRVARRAGAAAGFYALDLSEVASLEHLWVDPACMGAGIGRALVADALREAARRGHAVLEIDSDPYAEPFYQHLGARRVGWVSAPVAGTPRCLPRLHLAVPDGR